MSSDALSGSSGNIKIDQVSVSGGIRSKYLYRSTYPFVIDVFLYPYLKNSVTYWPDWSQSTTVGLADRYIIDFYATDDEDSCYRTSLPSASTFVLYVVYFE